MAIDNLYCSFTHFIHCMINQMYVEYKLIFQLTNKLIQLIVIVILFFVLIFHFNLIKIDRFNIELQKPKVIKVFSL